MNKLGAAALLGLSLVATACVPLPPGLGFGLGTNGSATNAPGNQAPVTGSSQTEGQNSGQSGNQNAEQTGNQNASQSGDQNTSQAGSGSGQTPVATSSEQPQGATVIPVIYL